MVIIVIVSKSHPTLVLFEYKPSRLGGIPSSCKRDPASLKLIFSSKPNTKIL